MRRMLLTALALSVAAVSPSLVSAAPQTILTTAHGIVEWHTSAAFLSQDSAGISRVVRLDDGQVEVGFSDPHYESLQSTVVVACRNSQPCFITWDSYAGDSVRVRIWEQDGTPKLAGSFSIVVFRTRGTGAAGESPAGEGRVTR